MELAAVVGFLIDENEQHPNRAAMRRLSLIKRSMRDISNPFLMPPEHFRQHYRLTPHLAFDLINFLKNQLERHRNSAIPIHLEVLAVVRYFSEGSFQKGIASDFNHPVSQPTMSRCITRVVNAIISLANDFIRFPQNAQERQLISNGFFRYNRIPKILGLIYCFKVAFWRPVENEEAFFNYSAGTAINVQIICDADYIIRDIRICPGSNIDYFIWLFSDAKEKMEQLRSNNNITINEGRYYLLGDNGYVPSTILLTPFTNAEEGTPEETYTSEHVRTRCKIEQCFGILINVWLCISRSRKLHYAPEKVAKIILACAILHNYRKINGMQDEFYNYEEEQVNVLYNDNYAGGIQERNRIINTYYRD